MDTPQPGDPKLVAQIVNRLKSQGLFDQFRRDCLADVDTKPAYQNLRQRVDSFVSNHLAGHTWSPHLNKNQLRNNIRQQVLNSGMLESGIDRIISQVVDPKINQMFRPQVEKAVHDFLNTAHIGEESSVNAIHNEEPTDSSGTVQQGLSTPGASANVANDAMSILETISSLNQEACSARSTTENPSSKGSDRMSKKLLTSQNIEPILVPSEHGSEEIQEKGDAQEHSAPELQAEVSETISNNEDLTDAPGLSEEVAHLVKHAGRAIGDSIVEIEDKQCKVTEKSGDQEIDEKKEGLIEKIEEIKNPDEKSEEEKSHRLNEQNVKEPDTSELLKAKVYDKSDEQKAKKTDKSDKKLDLSEKLARKEEKRDGKKEEKRENKTDKKNDHSKKTDEGLKAKEERFCKEREADSVKQPLYDRSSSKYRATDFLKDESSDDSDIDSLSDITVSSVHTSDLSSFEEESEGEVAVSDSTEEGEITSDDEDDTLDAHNKINPQNKTNPQTDEQSEGKSKPVRHSYVHKPYLYSRYYSDSDDEQTVEQRRQSIARAKEERLLRRQINREKLEEKRKLKALDKVKSLKAKNPGKASSEGASINAAKEALKEQMFLEKKVALSKRRQRESRVESSLKRKYDYSEDDSRDSYKTSEAFEKQSSTSKNPKHIKNDSSQQKSNRRCSEPVHVTEKEENKMEREQKRRASALPEGMTPDTETRHVKKRPDKFDSNFEEHQKKKTGSKTEKQKKDSSHVGTHNSRSTLKKDTRDKFERERSLSDDKSSSRHRHKTDSVQKTGDDPDRRSSERGVKGEDKQSKSSSDDKSDRKNRHKSEKPPAHSKDGKTDESVHRENSRKERHMSVEKSRSEHKSRSLTDSKMRRDSQGSIRQSSSASQKKTGTHSEDKYDLDSTNSDSNSKHEENIHKDRRRTKSSSEEKRSKPKNSARPSDLNEVEPQGIAQKWDRESYLTGETLNHGEGSISKESIATKLQRIAYSGLNPDKETCLKTKFQLEDKARERYKMDEKELSLSKPEKRMSTDCSKNKSSKQYGKESRKKEDCSTKAEDKKVEESPEKKHKQ